MWLKIISSGEWEAKQKLLLLYITPLCLKRSLGGLQFNFVGYILPSPHWVGYLRTSEEWNWVSRLPEPIRINSGHEQSLWLQYFSLATAQPKYQRHASVTTPLPAGRTTGQGMDQPSLLSQGISEFTWKYLVGVFILIYC